METNGQIAQVQQTPQQNPANPVISTQTAAPQQSSSNKILIGSMLVIAIIIGSVGTFAAMTILNPDDSENEPNDSTEADTVVHEDDEDHANLIHILEHYDEDNDNVIYTFGGDTLTITSNGIPDHETGEFPNDGNPNAISEQEYEYTIYLSPTLSDRSTPTKIFGITLGGILFDPGTAERDTDTGWSIEAFNNIQDLGLDFNNAHVQPSGAYHYHGIPSVLNENDETEHSSLIGFAVDGFPVYNQYGYESESDMTVKEIRSSWQLKEGERVDGPAGEYDGTYTDDFEFIEDSGDLDECNGRQTITPEYPNGTYAYFLTDSFPYVPRCVMGTPDPSFTTIGGGGGAGAEQQMPPERP